MNEIILFKSHKSKVMKFENEIMNSKAFRNSKAKVIH